MNKLFTISLLFASMLLYGQSDSLKKLMKAHSHFENFSYKLALDAYAEVNDESIETQRNIAYSYWKTNDLGNAERMYSRVVDMDGATKEDLYNHAAVLRELEAYDHSEKAMERYGSLNPDDSRYKEFTKHKGSWNDLLQNDKKVRLIQLRMNGGNQDFGVSYFGNQVVYVSSKEDFNPIRRRYNANQLPYLDLFTATIYDTNFVNVKPFPGKINSKFHEGPAAFDRSGTFMIYSKNDSKPNSDGRQHFHLYWSTMRGGNWSKPELLPFDTASWSSGHPSISEDGKWLYFSSTMDGGYGGADIWKVEIKGTGQFGTPENLGPEVNTEGNEVYPFIHAENSMFFFSSDGHYGLGGLDVFQGELVDGKVQNIQNMKAPVNSCRDDFAFIVDKEKKSGYLSSNREGSKGSDDIYHVVILKELESK